MGHLLCFYLLELGMAAAWCRWVVCREADLPALLRAARTAWRGERRALGELLLVRRRWTEGEETERFRRAWRRIALRLLPPLLYLALGGALAQQASFLLIPLSMLLGWYIISAEPAVHVLNRQVEEVSAGAISARAMGVSLSIGVSAAMGLSMLRVLTGLPILWLLLPGYAAALALSFFVPPIFTAIAFDSGGVASGPMTAAFMLPFCMGVSQALGGNLVADAFGVVALVAMMPLITIQLMGAVYVLKTRRGGNQILPEAYDDFDIIELWEVA